MTERRILSGLDNLLTDNTQLDTLRDCSVALLCHEASVTTSFEHAIDALQSRGVRIKRLFAPEHGVRGTEQAMDLVDEVRDPVTGIPVVSLYGDNVESLVPTPEMLEDIDVLVADVQDVGVRYYTYATTVWQTVEMATRCGVRSMVLDRPNPLGRRVDGPPVEEGFESFVGSIAIPNEHGLTTAEICGFAQKSGHELSFEVIRARGWSGQQITSEAVYAWVMPSPNMPTLHTAQVYAGMCLFEATNVSEGRGTTRPFELFGAPWLDPAKVRAELEPESIPGMVLRETSFKPTFEKGAGEVCNGFQIHVTDPEAFRSLQMGYALIGAIMRAHPDEFAWRHEPYEFVDDIPALDLLAGNARIRKLLESGAPFGDISSELRTPSWLHERLLDSRIY